LQLDDFVGVEGLPLAGTDMQSRVGDPTAWDVLLDAARAIERVPELLGLSPHLIVTATRPDGGAPLAHDATGGATRSTPI
jgi:hypothetical protein